MSFAEGLLTGVAGGMDRKRERKDRERMLSVMEAAASVRGAPMPGAAGGGAMAPGGAVTPYNGPIGDRVTHGFEFFRSKGVPDHVAAGLVGNLMQESGADINPAAVGDGGNAYGAGQWNGPRMRAYQAFAKDRGKPFDDYDTQLEFLWHEGQTSEKQAWDRIMATTTAEEAALVGSQAFWRPGVPHNERRQGYAASVYANRPASPSAAPATAAAAPPRPGEWFTAFFKE